MDASLETSAFAVAVTMRLWISCIWEIKRSEPARVSISRAEADWISHWSTTASVNPASRHSPDLFSLFATLRPSTVDDQGQIQRDLIQRDLYQYRVSVGSRHDGRLADRSLPDRGLANRHLADLSLLIDGLAARDVGGASGSHHGKRCTHYDHNFLHDTSPSKLEETRQ
jgi:hypothetical protein